MRTPTDSVPSEVLDGARRSSPPVPNASSTEFPGTARQTGSSTTSPLGVAVAIAATVLMMGGAAGWLILGDEGGTESLTTPRGTAAVNPSAAPAPSAPQAAPPTAFAEEAPAKRLLTITSTPTGATVRAPDGAVVGTTPMTLSRRDEKNLTILPDASERALDTVVLISEGYEAKTVSLDFPEKAGAEGTLAISLKVQVVVTVKADRRGVKVRVQGTTDGLGRTPFSWSVPGELAERIRAGEEVYLEYLTPTGPVAVALTPAHLDGGKGVKGLVRAKFTKSSSRRSKPAKSRKKAKPEKKKGWGW